jgi:antitoxin component YwqK of YwqJK toxin-antitoxin module
MRFLFLILLIISSASVSACGCWDYNRDMSRAYKEYAFIAHVKIIKKASLNINDTSLISDKDRIDSYRKVSVEIIELYKGTSNITILERGVGSSCDMGIQENQEWILFGNYVNKEFVGVGYCNTWFILKNAIGERQWIYDGGVQAAKELRKFAGMPEKNIADGRYKTYYPDGKLLANEEYKNGQLHGKREVYYSNGNLMDEGAYFNGTPSGKQTHYAGHGQILNEFFYENGEIIHSIFWYDTSYQERRMAALLSGRGNNEDMVPAKIQKQSEGWYDTVTKDRSSRVYTRMGFLEKEHFSYNDFSFKISCEYAENGNLTAEIRHTKKNDASDEQRWDKNGRLISHKKWLYGKLISQ